ncbi:MAG: hypothetical protein A2284_19080 [Deltaproteobacteria bacterium RIFOXYA12_FULL_61_11]|nr:MAG: hypothetical protein A2284_19080 [Deltaproteobacteria bacterium RIFOXYA12_FULL_61_11]
MVSVLGNGPETMERSMMPRKTLAPGFVWCGIAGLCFLSVGAAVRADERAAFVQGLQEVIRQADPNLQGRTGRITRGLEGLFEGPVGSGRMQRYFDLSPRAQGTLQGEAWREYLLGSSEPVSENTFPVLLAARACPGASDPVVDRAVSYIRAARDYHEDLATGRAGVYEERGKNLCNESVQGVFGATRRPGNKGDTITRKPGSGHIVVFYQGQPYLVPLYGERHGKKYPLNDVELRAMFEAIRACGSPGPPSAETCELGRPAGRNLRELADHCPDGEVLPVAALGHLPRKAYAAAYRQLSTENPATVKAIEDALFTVSLEPGSGQAPGTDPAALVQYSRGRMDPANGWTGKGLHVVFTEHGVLAECEHSIVDGTGCMQTQVEILRREDEQHFFEQSCASRDKTASRLPEGFGELTWKLSPALQRKVAEADAAYRGQVGATSIDLFDLAPAGFGQTKASVNTMFQMSHYLTKYTAYRDCLAAGRSGCVMPTIGEPIDTRALAPGSRLGINLTNTEDMQRFAETAYRAQRGEAVSNKALIELYQQAKSAHVGTIKAGKNGQGTLAQLLAINAAGKADADGRIAVGSAAGYIHGQQVLFTRFSPQISRATAPQDIVSNGTPLFQNEAGTLNGQSLGVVGFGSAKSDLSGPTDSLGFMTTPTGYRVVRYTTDGASNQEYRTAMQRNLEWLVWVAGL